METKKERTQQRNKTPNADARKNTQSANADKSSNAVPSFQLDDDIDDEVFLGQYLPQAESSRISFQLEQQVVVQKKDKMSVDFQKPDQAEGMLLFNAIILLQKILFYCIG